VVDVRGATRRFGDFTAVDAVDLSVEKGEVVGVLGANGAGKTTLMRMILGLLPPSSGAVSLFGVTPSRATRRRTGYVPQGLGLWTDLTAAENLDFTGGVFGIDPAPSPEGTADTLVGDLSLGQQRRVAFLAALQHRPDLLVLDEPTSGGAPLARARLWEEIRNQSEAIGRGSESDIVGDLAAVVVGTEQWDIAFTILEEAGFAATLAGRGLRVPGGETQAVSDALRAEGVDAEVEVGPATLEEAMVLARGT
jgi:ABC-2 type transport system ATP-binding protein/ribosome-dependent ATPase